MGTDQVENRSGPNQSISGENEGQTIKTGEQLMLMTLESRKQQVNSQKQSSRTMAKKIADRPKVYNQEETGTDDWEGTTIWHLIWSQSNFQIQAKAKPKETQARTK